MAKTISDLLDVSSKTLMDLGAFDPILDLDTRLFIDPHLLKHCDMPEFEASYDKFTSHFKSIVKLLDASEKRVTSFGIKQIAYYLEKKLRVYV